MITTTVHVHTGTDRVTDITDAAVTMAGQLEEGLLNIFVPHATAGLALIEIGSGSDRDLVAAIERLFPRDDHFYAHRHGTKGHGVDHVIPAFISPSMVIPVIKNKLALGRWQRIALVDPNVDNGERIVRLSLIPA